MGVLLMVKKIADISEHQGTIDFKKVKDEVEFVVIRAQYGSTKEDRKHKEYVAGCKENGVKFGMYAYCRFVSVQDAIVEANDFLKRADKDAQFLVADVEEVTTKNAKDLVPATQAFIDTLKKAGIKKVGLYTGHSFYNENNMKNVKADFLWIPRYGENKPKMACDIWQYTDQGKLNGIKGNVDLNYLNGSKAVDFFTGKTILPLPYGVIKKGHKGDGVKQLQRALEKAGFELGAIDGVYGEATYKALVAFQKKYKLSIDGIYGNVTRNALNKVVN
jgi:GH25 family lysozyme M1 (1,4-beta-N-acetylmuramidase)